MFHKRLLAEFRQGKKYTYMNAGGQLLCLLANLIFIGMTAHMAALLMDGSYEKGRSLLPFYLLLTAAMLALRFLGVTLQNKAVLAASDLVKNTMRDKLYEKLIRLGKNYQESVATSEIVQVTAEGVDQLEFYMSAYVPQFYYSMVAPFILFLVSLKFSWKVGLVLLICVPLIPVCIVIVQKVAKRLLHTYWGKYTSLGDTFLEDIQGLLTMKIYGSDEAYAKRMDQEAEDFRTVTMNVLKMQLNSIIVMDLIAYGGAALGAALSIWEYMQGAMSFEGCIFMILVSAEFFLPMRKLGSFFHVAMNGNAAADKAFRILDLEEQKKGEKTGISSQEICLSHVNFSYTQGKQILKDVSLTIPQGKVTALVGPSGCGKSTIVRLLMGEHSHYEGTIQIGDLELRDISEKTRMDRIVRVNHNSYIFKGTVRSNLLMGNPKAEESAMNQVLEIVDLKDFFESRGGLDYGISEQGSNLSGGQKQRLALARALLHDGDIYIFDEATSNVDVESEEKIMEVVRNLTGKTVLIIAHRLANVEDADKIYVLQQGSLAEEGNHEMLMGKSGVYAEMYSRQKSLESYGIQGKKEVMA